jgi:hypothetical protein
MVSRDLGHEIISPVEGRFADGDQPVGVRDMLDIVGGKDQGLREAAKFCLKLVGIFF